METFNLPTNTKVNRVVPKNTFDSYTNTKQKKIFADKVTRITWTHKLSSKTTNLKNIDISEIQIFKIELKVCETIPQVISIIDKAIPYPIIFIIQHKNRIYFATSIKHPHPTNENNTVVDWTFTSEWTESPQAPYILNLKVSLDEVHKDFCIQVSGREDFRKKSLDRIVEFHQEKQALESEIEKLKQQISRSKSFKEKVELNLKLKEKERELIKITKL